MSYGDYLKGLLRPLGLYRLEGTINGFELEAYGSQMDRCARHLDETAREMDLTTAETWGLAQYGSLLPFPLPEVAAESLRQGLSLLMGSGRCTLSALNQLLADWELEAQLRETEKPLTVEILYENPQRLEELKQVAEAVLPCHLEARYTPKINS